MLSFVIVIFPFWAVFFYLKNFQSWKDEAFEAKFGAALEGLCLNSRSIVAYPIIFVLRRMALMFVVTAAEGMLFAQLYVMIFFSTIQVFYLSTYKPFTEPLLLKLDIFNEFTTVILVDLLVILTDANPSKIDLQVDIFFLTCLFGNLAVHLFFLMKNSFLTVKTTCKKRKKSFFCFGRRLQAEKAPGLLVEPKAEPEKP